MCTKNPIDVISSKLFDDFSLDNLVNSFILSHTQQECLASTQHTLYNIYARAYINQIFFTKHKTANRSITQGNDNVTRGETVKEMRKIFFLMCCFLIISDRRQKRCTKAAMWMSFSRRSPIREIKISY